MQKTLKYFIGFILLCSLLSPYTYATNSVYAADENSDLVVSADELYLREGPGLSYPILKTLKEGQSLTFIEKQDDWYHVKVKGQEGWVASWLTSASKTSAPTSNNSSETGSIISQVDHLNVRAEPAVSSAVLTQLNTGDEAEVLAREASWVQISYNGTTGWVSADYVTDKKNEVDKVTNTSEQVVDSKDQEKDTNVEIDPNSFTVAVDVVNVRKKADLSSKKLGTAKKGEQYEVLDRENNWVKIQYGKKVGWVYSFYGTFEVIEQIPASLDPGNTDESESKYVTIIYNGTNLREEPSTSSNIVVHANAGEKYKILAIEGEWYKVEVDKNKIGYVANWVVSEDSKDLEDDSTKKEKEETKKKDNRKKGTLKGLTLVIDPGHGGNDKGTTGARGTDEKDINLKTVDLLKSKLRSAGAEVIMTRESDVYVDLRKRVSISHQHAADAFISIHYDATQDTSISGFTTYYTNGYQRELAEYVHEGLAKKVTIRDRGVQPGNYLVTRENKQAAILIELGYLSNPNEESVVTTDFYREQATLGIYQGLLKYFDAQLEE